MLRCGNELGINGSLLQNLSMGGVKAELADYILPKDIFVQRRL